MAQWLGDLLLFLNNPALRTMPSFFWLTQAPQHARQANVELLLISSPTLLALTPPFLVSGTGLP